MKKCLFILLILSLVGCATTGVKVNKDNLSKIKEGETTKEQVIQLLGNPNMVNLTSDGKTILMYHFFEYKTKARSFVPVVGLLAGGGDMNQEILQVLLDENDVVEKYIYNDSNSEIKTGVLK